MCWRSRLACSAGIPSDSLTGRSARCSEGVRPQNGFERGRPHPQPPVALYLWRFSLEGPLQRMVEGSFGLLVLLSRHASLLAIDFKLE
jgi:hypothetical protein